MLLKRIVLVGFKSFADRVAFHLTRNITGIVGPNGSGKSNVIDAVRWVMGEQNTRLLRGERATDIIFAGSSKRQPLGMAEVTLTFDNSRGTVKEYSHETEISLTRRIYPDGHREYLINKNSCRLKDLVDFFTITGLGSKSYSMIQQGQVDRVLNAKPEDIREVIEEAAGTVIFKKRKSETEKKLESAKANLLRVEDVLVELKRQKEALAEQVEKAKKWQGLTKALDETQRQIIGYQYRETTNKLAALDKELRLETKQEMDTYRVLTQYQNQRNTLQRQLNDNDPQVAKIESEIAHLRENIREFETLIVKAKLQKENTSKRLEELAVDIEEDEEELTKIEEELYTCKQEHGTMQSRVRTLDKELDHLGHKLQEMDTTASDTVLREEEFRAEINRLTQISAGISVSQRLHLHTKEKSLLEKEKLDKRQTTVIAEHHLTIKQEKKLRTALGNEEAGLDVSMQKKNKLEAEIKKIKQDMLSLDQQKDKAKEIYFQKKARYNSAEAEITQQKNNMFTNTKLLADYLTFKENSSELPPRIISAFERWSEKIIIQDINWLKNFSRTAAGDGSVAGVILDWKRPAAKKQLEEWGKKFEVIPFRNYLVLEDEVKKIFDFVYLTLNLELESELITSLPPQVTLFTPYGSWLTDAGEMTLVRTDREGIISKQKLLTALHQEVDKARRQLTTIQAKIDLNQEIKASNELEINALEKKLAVKNKDLSKVMAGYHAISRKLDHEKSILAEIEEKQKEIAAEIATVATQIETDNKTKIALEQELKELKDDFARFKSDYESYEKNRAKVVAKENALKLELMKVNTTLETLNKELANKDNIVVSTRNKLLRRCSDRDFLLKNSEQAEHDRQEYLKSINHLVQAQEKKSGSLLERKQNIQGLIQKLKKIETQITKCQKEQSSTQKSISLKSVTKGQLETSLQGIMEHATALKDFDPTTQKVEDIDIERLLGRRENLKEELASIEAVNMLAIEEYDKLLAREEFIVKQQQELISSIDFLRQAATEIEQNSAQRFRDVFTQVNKEFTNLFPVLFPTGQASLVLDNTDAPLTAGVQIMVQLPGKKKQHMNLFSGGEKALTAISLIFALLKTKPTPFCFLDEVDAALDEANVARFNRVLQELAQEFQFILVTHNRKTMEVFDHIYGVTMQEPGVSKVVGIDLDKGLPPVLRKGASKIPPAASRERKREATL